MATPARFDLECFTISFKVMKRQTFVIRVSTSLHMKCFISETAQYVMKQLQSKNIFDPEKQRVLMTTFLM